jgi:hypothetical protein
MADANASTFSAGTSNPSPPSVMISGGPGGHAKGHRRETDTHSLNKRQAETFES